MALTFFLTAARDGSLWPPASQGDGSDAPSLTADGGTVQLVSKGRLTRAPRSAAEGAEGVVWLATIGDDGPRGGFFKDREVFPW